MSQPASPFRRHLRTLISVLVLAIAIAVLVRTIGMDGMRDLGRRMASADPALLALAALVNLGRYGLWALRWKLMARGVVVLPLWTAFRSLMVSVFLNTVVPAARPLGGIIRARLAARFGRQPAGPYYGATLVDQFGYSMVSGLVGAACLPWALVGANPSSQSRGLLPWILGGLGIVVAGILIHPGLRGRLASFMERRMPKARTTMVGAAGASRTVLARPVTYVLMLFGGSTVWLINVLVLWLTGRAVGVPFSMEAAASAWALGSLAGAVSGTPGGAGTTEGAAIIPLVQEGFGAPEALAAVLLARGLHYLSALLVGGACFITRPAGSGPLTEAESEPHGN